MSKYINTVFNIFFGILLLYGCATYNDFLPENSNKLNDNNDLYSFNGFYSNLPESYDSSNPNLLWGKIKLRSVYSSEWKFSNVRLQYKGNNKILAQLVKDSVVIDEKILKGKIRNNCFYIRGTFYILPFPLYFGYYNDRKRLIPSDHESLFLENTWNYWVFFTIGGETSKEIRINEYKKTK